MQVVSNDFRPTLYSGNAEHIAVLTIGNTTIDNENIKSIKVSNPIIDKTNDTFYIGTFVSKQVEIELFNADELDLTGQLHLSIGTYIESLEDYEILDIGYFNIETSPEDYYKNAKIVALDNGVKFKPNVDYSEAMEYKYYQTSDTTYQQDKQYYSLIDSEYVLLVEGTDYNVGDNITGTVYERSSVPLISCEDLLIWLCNHFEVSLGTYPNTNKNIEISTYDSSVSGKQYISYIAEIMGGNAQIGRDGYLYIIPLKQTPSVQINATEGKSWELGDKYEISGVSFFDALRTATIESGTNQYNKLYIRSDNPFVVGDNDEVEEIIENIYDEVEGTIIYNLKCENYADYSLDSWDFIEYVLDIYVLTEDTTFVEDKSYYEYIDGEYVEYEDERTGNPSSLNLYEEATTTYQTINNHEYTYEMTIMGKVEVEIPNKQVEETTNVVEGNELTKYNILKTKINNANNEIDIIAGQGDEIQGQLETLTISQEGLTNNFVKTGGNNLLLNTGLHFTNEDGSFTYWEVSTHDPTDENQKLDVVSDSESLSGTDMVLPYGRIKQTINIYDYLTPAQIERYQNAGLTLPITHILSFSYKRNISSSNCSVYINGNEIQLGNEDEWTLFNEDLGELSLTSNVFTIEFECNVQGGYYIKELMLNSGNERLDYSQNINEMRTDTIQISDGIVVSSSSSNTISRHDSDGFRVLNKQNKEVILRATENGIETKNIKAKEDSEIAGLVIKNYENHVLLSGKGGN